MTTYNGMPREVRSEIASHFLSDLASTDMNEYRRFIGDSKPEYFESVSEPETEETSKDAEDPESSRDDTAEFKVGDRYSYKDNNCITLEIIEVNDNYVKLKTHNNSDPFLMLLYSQFVSEQNRVETIRKDIFRFMLKTNLIEKIK